MDPTKPQLILSGQKHKHPLSPSRPRETHLVPQWTSLKASYNFLLSTKVMTQPVVSTDCIQSFAVQADMASVSSIPALEKSQKDKQWRPWLKKKPVLLGLR